MNFQTFDVFDDFRAKIIIFVKIVKNTQKRQNFENS